MEKTLVISACNYIIPEIAQVLNNGDYPNVKLIGFSAKCSKGCIDTSKILSHTSKIGEKNPCTIIIGGICNSLDQKIPANENIKKIRLEQCFELILNRDTVSYYISKGYYIVTNGWLKSYKQNIADWGFDKETAKLMFKESMKGILLLDTKIDGDYMPNLISFSEYIGLPYEIIPVGLSYCEKYIDSLISEWVIEHERNSLNEKISSISRQSADYSLIFHQLETLVNLTDETSIIQVGFDLLNILFAPSNTKFINNDTKKPIKTKNTHNQAIKKQDCFTINITHRNELLGIFEVNEVKFPQYISYYKKTGVVISQIFGLSIANARKYSTTIKQQKQLEIYTKKLQNINRSKDKFFSIISHDLNGPFTTIIGFAELLIKKAKHGDIGTVRKYAHYINDASNKTLILLQNLLNWAQSQTNRIDFKPEIYTLSELINETIILLQLQAEHKIIIIKNNIPIDLKVFCDKNMIETVFRNLISNAIKFTENGEIIISSETLEDAIQISISDTGIGIKAGNIKKLFTIGETVKTLGTNREIGTGLGLILCKEFIEKHNGKIWVESKLHKGSTFYFSLPHNKQD